MSDLQAVAEVIEPFVEDSMERSNEIIAGLWKKGYRIVERAPRIDVNLWKDERSPEGYMILERRKTIREVFDELLAIVGREGPGHNEYLTAMPPAIDDQPWPDGRIVCYPVVGDSEGDYVHIDVVRSKLDGTGQRVIEAMFLAKTFDGTDAAWAFARQCADIFDELSS